MTLFVDSSAWFAAVNLADRNHERAKAVLSSSERLVTTDHVVVETWLLVNARISRFVALQFWERIRVSDIHIEFVAFADLEMAWEVCKRFEDQDFSIVDASSFVVLERLGLTRAASFDSHFAIYRYGPGRSRAFEIVR